MGELILHAETLNPCAELRLNVESVGLTPDQFYRLCGDNPELRLELTARKEIVIMPPAGSESGAWNFNVNGQLGEWIRKDGRGIGFDSSAGFTLPNGAVRAPDGAWVLREKWNALTKQQRMKFAPVVPEFVIEIRSQSETLPQQKTKMEEYIAVGVRLGWLLDPFARNVYIYRPGQEPRLLENPESVSADPELSGFVLDLTQVWS
jgi:Uma2 family endonuclease